MRELHSNIKAVTMIAPIVGNNDTEGTPAAGADLKGFNSCELIAMCGVSGDTLSGSVKVDIILEESDDDSTWTAVTDANDVVFASDGTVAAPDSNGLIATIDDAAEDPDTFRIGYIGNKRYARLRFDFTGTHTNGMPISSMAILGHPAKAPTSD